MICIICGEEYEYESVSLLCYGCDEDLPKRIEVSD
jgi:hypothetical protein